MLIHVHVTVASNSIPYYLYMVRNYLALASGKNQVKFFAHCLDKETFSKLHLSKETFKAIEVYKNPKFYVLQTWRDLVKVLVATFGFPRPMSGSNGHSAGISSALSITGSAVDIIADADTVLLKRNWDVTLLELLSNYGIVGTSYEDIGGFSSGSGNIQTYKRKPSMTWFAMSPRFNWKDLDPKPSKADNIKIINSELSSLYNLPIGAELARDVGWNLPLYLEDNNISYIAFDQIKPTSGDALVLKSGIDYHEEFHHKGNVFLAHQRGSHKHKFRASHISESFYNSCDMYMKKIGIDINE
jgi:hypothetical protein